MHLPAMQPTLRLLLLSLAFCAAQVDATPPQHGATARAQASKEPGTRMEPETSKGPGSGYLSFVGGGGGNDASGGYSAVVGGLSNTSGADLSFVGGGYGNLAGDIASVVGGGYLNTAYERYAVVSGGERNEVVGRWGVLAGGNYNLVSGDNGTVSGGGYNVASGEYSSVGGGLFNDARGFASRVGGGDANCAGADFSWAGGQGARARPATAAADGPCSSGTVAGGDVGSFVWSDAYAWPGAVFESTGPNQFLVQAAGGMALNTSVLPRHTTLLVKGRPGSDGNANLYLEHGARTVGFNLGVGAVGSTGAQLFIARFNRSSYVDLARFRSDGRFEVFVDNPVKPGGGSWAAASDARLKHHVEELDGATALQQLLELRGVRFAYRDDAPDRYAAPGNHLGFIAQDVEQVFPDWVSRDSEGYRLVGPRGFEALTVEALRELKERSDGELAALRAHNDALRAEMDALRTDMLALRAALSAGRNVAAQD